MWSPVEKTALAEAEVEYEDITSTQLDVAFEIVGCPNAPELVGAHAVIWTTTPWTIPVNQALAYGPEVEYNFCWFRSALGEEIPTSLLGKRFIIAKELTGTFLARVHKQYGLPQLGIEYSPVIEGKKLAGATARHPMHKLGGFFAAPRPFLPGGRPDPAADRPPGGRTRPAHHPGGHRRFGRATHRSGRADRRR
jgi:isoleucyl-tRNA synthetase